MSLQDKDFQARSIEFITKEKERLYQELTKIPLLKVFYPSVNFILVKILTENMTSTKLTRLLAEKGVLVRNCNTFNGLGEKFIRVAVRTREENNLLIKNLEKIILSGGKSD